MANVEKLTEHKDFLDRKIELGDSVVFVRPDSRELELGRVIKLTNKNVRVSYIVSRGWKKGNEESTVRIPKDVVKVDGPELTMFLLKRT